MAKTPRRKQPKRKGDPDWGRVFRYGFVGTLGGGIALTFVLPLIVLLFGCLVAFGLFLVGESLISFIGMLP